MPPIAFVSIVGHAIFHTADRRSPSTMERSYRRRPGAADGAPRVGAGERGEASIGDAVSVTGGEKGALDDRTVELGRHVSWVVAVHSSESASSRPA